MPRVKLAEQPEEIQELEEQLKAKKMEFKRRSLLEQAQRTIDELESEYAHAKEVFFKVNGAKRILKNQ